VGWTPSEGEEEMKRDDYALITLPMMKDGAVYPEACIVVLVERVNMVGIPQKYLLPGEPFSVRPHHLATVSPIANQKRAAEWFMSGEKFMRSPRDAILTLGTADSP
jgi:hypothetical protein